MIVQVGPVDPQQGPERRTRFLDAVRGRPYFGDLLPVELAVFGAMHGPVPRFFTATPAAALCVRGRGALLCGTYDLEETGGFLQLHGVEQVQTDGAPPVGYAREQRLYCMAFSGASKEAIGAPAPISPGVPVSPESFFSPEESIRLEPPTLSIAGLTLDKAPPPGETADFLMHAKGAEIRDNFYSELCAKLARGAACVWAVRQAEDGCGDSRGDGRIIASAGAYALTPETAYLAAIETAEPLRGKGIGSWLVGTLAAQLAGEGRRVALVCAGNRVPFYERLGFKTENTVWRCTRETEV